MIEVRSPAAEAAPAATGPVLAVLCCRGFGAEVRAAVAAEGWSDVAVAEFPLRCGRPPLAWDELRALLPAGCTQVVVAGRACLTRLDAPPADFPPMQFLRSAQCYHLLADPAQVDAATAAGGYLVGHGWLADWRGELRQMGFDPDQPAPVREFFHDFARELVLVDCGIDSGDVARLAEVGALLGLPVRSLAAGLQPLRLRLAHVVWPWRLATAQARAQARERSRAAELADYAAAMDLLAQLTQAETETAAVDAVLALFQMLFAPAALHCLRLEGDALLPHGPVPAPLLSALQALRTQAADHGWTPDGTGFLLRIAQGGEALALVAVDRLAFPQHRARYLNLALAVAGVCGLAIANARNRRRLVEAQMLSALGTVVVGVAHEIGTPLGVGLAAATALQDGTRRLAERFAARQMTQAELQAHLDDAGVSADLLARSLERIGRLVEAFHRVAVGQRPAADQRFEVRSCLDDVVLSLRERLAGVEVRIDCDPALQVTGSQDDWVGIFRNLLDNSLVHGFGGRGGGHIELRVARAARDRLVIDYTDDGAGMAPAVVERLYQPFFTTRMQQHNGLGMYLVYNLVTQRLGGRIACDSAPGSGVHFRIELPATQEDAR